MLAFRTRAALPISASFLSQHQTRTHILIRVHCSRQPASYAAGLRYSLLLSLPTAEETHVSAGGSPPAVSAPPLASLRARRRLLRLFLSVGVWELQAQGRQQTRTEGGPCLFSIGCHLASLLFGCAGLWCDPLFFHYTSLHCALYTSKALTHQCQQQQPLSGGDVVLHCAVNEATRNGHGVSKRGVVLLFFGDKCGVNPFSE